MNRQMGYSTRPYNLMPPKRGPSNRPEDAAALEVATPPRRPRPWPRISNGAGARAHHSLTPMCPLQLKGISKTQRAGMARLARLREFGTKVGSPLAAPPCPVLYLLWLRPILDPLPFLPSRP